MPTPDRQDLIARFRQWGGETHPVEVRGEPHYGIGDYIDLTRREILEISSTMRRHELSDRAYRLAGPFNTAPEVELVAPDHPSLTCGTNNSAWVDKRYDHEYPPKRATQKQKVSSSLKSLTEALAGQGPSRSWTKLAADLSERFASIVVVGGGTSVADGAHRLHVADVQTPSVLDCMRVPLRMETSESLDGLIHLGVFGELPGPRLVIINHHCPPDSTDLLNGFLSEDDGVVVCGYHGRFPALKNWGESRRVAPATRLYTKPPGHWCRDRKLGIGAERWPRISLVIVSMNQAQYIGRCLDSIVEQEYPNLEIVVVDGASTDGAWEIIKSYRSRLDHLVSEPDDGQSDALNKGFARTTGELLNWVCSDDMVPPGALHRVGHAYRQYQADLVVGGCQRVNENDKILLRHHNGLPYGQKVPLSFGDMLTFTGTWDRAAYFYQPDVYFSRNIWERSGGYIKRSMYYAMDIDLYLRFALAGAYAIHVPDIIGSSRIHSEQKTQHERPEYLPTVRSMMMEYQNAFLALQAKGPGGVMMPPEAHPMVKL